MLLNSSGSHLATFSVGSVSAEVDKKESGALLLKVYFILASCN